VNLKQEMISGQRAPLHVHERQARDIECQTQKPRASRRHHFRATRTASHSRWGIAPRFTFHGSLNLDFRIELAECASQTSQLALRDGARGSKIAMASVTMEKVQQQTYPAFMQ
jgi:hypothetical protein